MAHRTAGRRAGFPPGMLCCLAKALAAAPAGATAALLLASGAFAATRAPAQPEQDSDRAVAGQQNVIAIQEAVIADIEAARLRGDCGRVEQLRSDFFNVSMAPLPRDVRLALIDRMNAVYDADCPPRGETPSPPPPTTPPPPPVTSPIVSYVQVLAPLIAGTDAAIGACDRAAFQAAKNRVLEALGQLISRDPNDQWLLLERRRIEGLQFPNPCPPVETGYIPGGGLPMVEEDLQWMAELGPVYRRFEIPPVNYGFLRDGPSGAAPETPAGFSEERVDMFGFVLGVKAPRIGSFSFGYGEGSVSGSFQIPVLGNGGASGIVNTDQAPSTSTGVTGNFGTTGVTDVAIQTFEGVYRYHFSDVPPVGWTAEPRISLNPFVGVTGVYRDRDHQALLEIVTTLGSGFQVQVSQQLDQEVTEHELGALLGLDATAQLGSNVRVDLRAEAGLYHFDFDLHSLETRTQNIGPTSDQSFTNLIEDGESGIGYSGSLQIGLTVAIDPRFELFAAGRANFFSERARVFNPFSGDFLLGGGTSFIGSDQALDLIIMIGARIPLVD